MQILSHRGLWHSPVEKNTTGAFRRSFESGFGTETDLRDLLGGLVISHDPPVHGALSAAEFFDIYRTIAPGVPLALNVKSDGLQRLLKSVLESGEVKNYFLFDMSVPDALVASRHGLRIFTRQSELEPIPSLYDQSAGVWMDCFFTEWMTEQDIASHLTSRKQVCLVSPELHGRPHLAFWERLAAMSVVKSDDVLLCTDRPEEARAVFA